MWLLMYDLSADFQLPFALGSHRWSIWWVCYVLERWSVRFLKSIENWKLLLCFSNMMINGVVELIISIIGSLGIWFNYLKVLIYLLGRSFSMPVNEEFELYSSSLVAAIGKKLDVETGIMILFFMRMFIHKLSILVQ